jgi:hypothetical protein
MHETKRVETPRMTVRLARRASVSARTAVLCILPALAGFGCTTVDTPFGDPEDSRINFEVANRSFQDITLHVTWSGKRVRLGSVSGTMTSNFVIPWSQSEDIQVEIDVFAGPRVGSECITRPIVANPGDYIYLEITNQLLRDPECYPVGGSGRPG